MLERETVQESNKRQAKQERVREEHDPHGPRIRHGLVHIVIVKIPHSKRCKGTRHKVYRLVPLAEHRNLGLWTKFGDIFRVWRKHAQRTDDPVPERKVLRLQPGVRTRSRSVQIGHGSHVGRMTITRLNLLNYKC